MALLAVNILDRVMIHMTVMILDTEGDHKTEKTPDTELPLMQEMKALLETVTDHKKRTVVVEYEMVDNSDSVYSNM